MLQVGLTDALIQWHNQWHHVASPQEQQGAACLVNGDCNDSSTVGQQ